MAHDLNGPSRLYMRAACPGSANAERGLPEETSEAAAEGTRLHEIFTEWVRLQVEKAKVTA